MMVHVPDNSFLPDRLKLFKRKVKQEGILADLKKHEAYLKPSTKKKRKREAAKVSRQTQERRSKFRKE